MKLLILIIALIITSAFFSENNLFCQVLKNAANKSKILEKPQNQASSLTRTDSVYLEVKAGAILNVGITSATSGGSILTNRFPDIIKVGLCWNNLPKPTVYNNKMFCNLDSAGFIGTMTNLFADSLFFFRAFAITSYDTVYSKDKIFYTHRTNAVADADGNYYNTVKIGSQIWLGEDLKTTSYNDGTPIVLSSDYDKWAFNETPSYCWYGNDSVSFSFPRGKLYKWFAVKTGKLCPGGWHVPSDQEWITLQSFLGGDSIAGGKLKTRGTLFWRDPNVKATGESGFSAFPAGYRNPAGTFTFGTIFDYWWSNDEYSAYNANSWYVYHATGYLYKQTSAKTFGYSVRCLKD